jgi:MATE family multidrug resistance protein
VAVAMTIVGWLTSYLVPLLGIDPVMIPLAQSYIRILSVSLIALFTFQGVREFLQAHEDVLFANCLSAGTVILNAFLAYAFLYGRFGFPAMGPEGLTLAILISRFFMAVVLLIYAKKYLMQRYVFEHGFVGPVIRLSIPISITVSMELVGWAGAALLIGRMGTVQAAAHNIIVNLASLIYMVPVALASASAVKVGFAFGAKDSHATHRYIGSAMTMIVTFMAIIALLFVFFPHTIINFYTQDSELRMWAVRLLYVAAVFQIFDGSQQTLSGCLRGLGITKPSMIAGFLGYCLIGIPLGLLLAHHFHLQALGMWIGLAIAIIFVAVMLGIYLFTILRKLRKNL